MRIIQTTLAALALSVTSVANAELAVFDITIKDHKFSPETVTVPTGEKVKLKVFNADSTPEEFESYTLNREKIIPGNSRAIIFVGPLDAGEYEFFGEFNQDTAQGRIIAK